MSSTAVIITGNSRTFAHNWKNNYWYFFRKLSNPHFFCCVEDDPQAESMELIKERYPGKVWIKKVKTPEIQLPPEADPGKDYWGGYPCSGPYRNVFAQFWNLEEGWKFFLDASPEWLKFAHNTVVRVRPDLWFQEVASKHLEVSDNTVFVPGWGSYGGINDRLAIMGPSAAPRYFTLYSRIRELIDQGCPLHPETLMAANLEGLNVCQGLLAEFKFCRMPDKQHPVPWGQPEPFIPFELSKASVLR